MGEYGHYEVKSANGQYYKQFVLASDERDAKQGPKPVAKTTVSVAALPQRMTNLVRERSGQQRKAIYQTDDGAQIKVWGPLTEPQARNVSRKRTSRDMMDEKTDAAPLLKKVRAPI